MYRAVSIGIPTMEVMTHNKKGVPCLKNGIGKSGGGQKFQGTVVDIQMIDDGNPKKSNFIIRNKIQAKKKKVLDDQNETLYAKLWKKLMMQ